MVLLKNTFIALLEIVTLISKLDGFEIKKTSVSPEGPVKVGSTVELSCQTDDHYEYCDWWVGEFDDQKECRFEWKSKHGAVKKQKCPTLKNRMQFDGNYDAHECKVVLSNVGLADAGMWTCKIEEYATFGRGPVRRKEIKLDVFEPPPPSVKGTSSYLVVSDIGVKGTYNSLELAKQALNNITSGNRLIAKVSKDGIGPTKVCGQQQLSQDGSKDDCNRVSCDGKCIKKLLDLGQKFLDSDDNNSMDSGAIVGIVIAILVVIGIIAAAGYFLYTRKSGKGSTSEMSVIRDGGQ